MNKTFIVNENKRKVLSTELILIIVFLSNTFSCATQVKVEPKKKEKQGTELKMKIPPLNKVEWPLPKNLESVDLSPLKKHKSPTQIIPTQNNLWLIYYHHLEVISLSGKKTIQYKSLDKSKTKITVRPNTGFTLIWSGVRSERPEHFWHFGSEVTLLLDGFLYRFKEDGTYIKKKRTIDKWWELKQGEYAKYNWTVEYENGPRLRFGYRKPIPKSNRRIPRKKISASGFAFAGPWVLVLQRDPNNKRYLKKLVLFDRRTAEVAAEFKYLVWDEDSKIRYDFRVHENGVYVDRYEGHPSQPRITPVRWFGEKIVDLDHGPDVFCYVFKSEKKCIDNADHQLRDVVEMENYRVLQTKKNLYIEGFSKTK